MSTPWLDLDSLVKCLTTSISETSGSFGRGRPEFTGRYSLMGFFQLRVLGESVPFFPA